MEDNNLLLKINNLTNKIKDLEIENEIKNNKIKDLEFEYEKINKKINYFDTVIIKDIEQQFNIIHNLISKFEKKYESNIAEPKEIKHIMNKYNEDK